MPPKKSVIFQELIFCFSKSQSKTTITISLERYKQRIVTNLLCAPRSFFRLPHLQQQRQSIIKQRNLRFGSANDAVWPRRLPDQLSRRCSIQLIGMDILNMPPKVLFEALPAELAQFGQTWVHHSELPLSLLNELSTYTCRHRGLTERR